MALVGVAHFGMSGRNASARSHEDELVLVWISRPSISGALDCAEGHHHQRCDIAGGIWRAWWAAARVAPAIMQNNGRRGAISSNSWLGGRPGRAPQPFAHLPRFANDGVIQAASKYDNPAAMQSWRRNFSQGEGVMESDEHHARLQQIL